MGNVTLPETNISGDLKMDGKGLKEDYVLNLKGAKCYFQGGYKHL